MPNSLILLIIGVVLIWLVALTFFFWKILDHYNKLTQGVSNKTLKTVLEEILRDMELNKKDIDYLKSYSARIDKDGNYHIQKVGLKKFNPFKDTGGEQSFILSLVDKNDTGVIISGLYSRTGTRWYAKKVVNGKGADIELSEEEKTALKDSATAK